MSDKLEDIVKEFWMIIDSVEESDSGHFFHPTTIEFGSCRVMQGKRLGELIEAMKEKVGLPPRMSEKDMYLLNNPDGCGECLGKGHHKMVECKACGGSGSTDPTVPMICTWCNGTGDTENHERASNDCTRCDRQGRVKRCTAPDCDQGTIKLVKTVDWHDCPICNGNGVIPVYDW